MKLNAIFATFFVLFIGGLFILEFSSHIFSETNLVSAIDSYNSPAVYKDYREAKPIVFLSDIKINETDSINNTVLDVVYSDLVWSDEFDLNGAVNAEKWFHQTQIPSGGSWFNDEEQHYTDRLENSYVKDGFLCISAIKELYTNQDITKTYTSARLNSKFAFTYGRVDVRAKLPFGAGTWPAIWTLGKNINEDGGYWDNEFGTVGWPACGEIDIMEHGLGALNHVSSALHSPCNQCFGDTVNLKAYELNDVANEFHVYSMNWSPNQITFLIDDEIFYTYKPEIKDSGTWPYFEDQYLLLNIAMGGAAGPIDLDFTQSSMVIDYVRVYQNTK
ncbi:glycoside hydrolase family 16 protein [Winogradskyella vidalii]|uniref:glycoside hydrolase family 16 protein n=1 Tax=Winogradskyella vidalii TaxID=2615024 RepID=UPI0015CE65FD|nr:glycoside hydrolase family 16 protein [Winogradskyella vidalii]